MLAYIHTCIHTYIHSCMHAHIHTHIHTYIHTYTHTQTDRQTDRQTDIHTYIYMFTYIHLYLHPYLCWLTNACSHGSSKFSIKLAILGVYGCTPYSDVKNPKHTKIWYWIIGSHIHQISSFVLVKLLNHHISWTYRIGACISHDFRLYCITILVYTFPWFHWKNPGKIRNGQNRGAEETCGSTGRPWAPVQSSYTSAWERCATWILLGVLWCFRRLKRMWIYIYRYIHTYLPTYIHTNVCGLLESG